MPASDAKMNYIRRYNEANYEKLTLMLKPGTKAAWRGVADRRGVSLTVLISEAMEEYIEKH